MVPRHPHHSCRLSLAYAGGGHPSSLTTERAKFLLSLPLSCRLFLTSGVVLSGARPMLWARTRRLGIDTGSMSVSPPLDGRVLLLSLLRQFANLPRRVSLKPGVLIDGSDDCLAPR